VVAPSSLRQPAWPNAIQPAGPNAIQPAGPNAIQPAGGQAPAPSPELLAGLTPAQLAAVTSDAAPLCLIASAGAGKTRVLTRRIAYRCQNGTADARHTLALTFTRKAAAELQFRLADLGLRDGIAAGTFHAHAAAQLQRWWSDRRQRRPTLLERKARLLGPLLEGRPGLGQASVAELAAHIEWAKARDITPAEFAQAVDGHARALQPGISPAAVAALYERYEHEKRRRGLIDFDDLLAGCAAAIERDPEFAGAQRWRWRHIYVDEFQDLNPLQHRLLLAWLGPSTDLCVVGDPHQAIYGWNGADPGLLEDLPRRWPSTEVLHLDANHRCTEEVVRAAAAVLGPGGSRLRGAGRRGPQPDVQRFASDRAEAAGITAAAVGAHREGRSWSDMAILTRTNAQLVVIQGALLAAGVPVWSAARAGLLEDPSVAKRLESLRARADQPLRVAIADLREMEGGEPGLEDGHQLHVLIELARALELVEPGASIGSWLSWLPAAVGDRSSGSARNAITLSSFHRAKGLEWEWVWLAGLEEGLVPMTRGSSEAEERQLLYVALTRAGTELHVSWAETRSFGGRPVPRQPSRWTHLIRDGKTDAGGAASPEGEGWRAGWSGARIDLRDRTTTRGRPLGRRTPPGWPEPDGVVVAALRAWRLETARSSGVPPYAVLHDVTIEAIASFRPANVDELLAVPGLGPVKASRYGPSLLALVSDRAASA
jgi:DNA helicase-2/ATP-dependent DNA helicase PcrA